MNESPDVSLVSVIAGALWIAAVLALLSFAVLYAEHRGLALFMGFASGILGPAAAALTVKSWLISMSRLMRLAMERPHQVIDRTR